MVRTSKQRDRLWVNLKHTWRYVRPCGWNLVGYAVVSIVSIAEGVLGIFTPILSAKVILNLTGNMMGQLIWSALAVFGINLLLSAPQFFKDIFQLKIIY